MNERKRIILEMKKHWAVIETELGRPVYSIARIRDEAQWIRTYVDELAALEGASN